MKSQIITTGLDLLQSRIGNLQDLDFAPLMAQWAEVIERDNRRGVLAGLDKDGNPMPPVTYRPKLTSNIGGFVVTHLGGQFGGRGKATTTRLPNNNLTTSEYLKLTGPPLAPRGINSRVISNFETGFSTKGPDWFAVGSWTQVVSAQGTPFLPYHFEGVPPLKRRDLAGVRPEGMREARELLNVFISQSVSGGR